LRAIAIASDLFRPTHIVSALDGSRRLFITEQQGIVRVFEHGALAEAPFLDISDRVSCCGEYGLLSIAFPPGEPAHVYAYYVDHLNRIVISRFAVAPDGRSAVPESEWRLLIIHPVEDSHYGGQLVFGPDGFLYAGVGDGGAGEGEFNQSQSESSFLGKILRIDPTAQLVASEIWARGLRNPWRFSFDRATGDLFIGDVGQSGYEEIDYEPAETRQAGVNYGWNLMEGTHCSGDECDASITLPIFAYDHDEGCSVTGGFVYRGKQIPALYGIYVFGDYCTGRVYGLRRGPEGWESHLFTELSSGLASFGEDEDGELYIADNSHGIVYAIEAAPDAGAPPLRHR
jgi:glucose/arabinose dehydrogenase